MLNYLPFACPCQVEEEINEAVAEEEAEDKREVEVEEEGDMEMETEATNLQLIMLLNKLKKYLLLVFHCQKLFQKTQLTLNHRPANLKVKIICWLLNCSSRLNFIFFSAKRKADLSDGEIESDDESQEVAVPIKQNALSGLLACYASDSEEEVKPQGINMFSYS